MKKISFLCKLYKEEKVKIPIAASYGAFNKIDGFLLLKMWSSQQAVGY